MKRLILIFAVSFAVLASSAFSQPTFENYPVQKYGGQTRLPKWIYRDKEYPDMWRDKSGKATQDPEINFAGRYFLASHSCGTQCKYYTLTDLLTGTTNHVGHHLPFVYEKRKALGLSV